MDFFTIKPHRTNFLSLFLSVSLLLLLSFFTFSTSPKSSSAAAAPNLLRATQTCSGVHRFADYKSKCLFVKSNSDCVGNGYINYLEIFYCTCGSIPAVGYFVLLLWLVILFYVLGNTTADYFCPSVESLSRVLKLSPTIAGTTLLPLGNGANDVFASVISFTRSGDADVGLNSVLGGAFFISCFVVGVVSISISSRQIKVDKTSFIRDVLFFLFVLCCLIMIVVFEYINLWFALCFFSLYFLYIGVVCLMQFFRPKEEIEISPNSDEFRSIDVPLLTHVVDEEKSPSLDKPNFKSQIQNSTSRSSYYLNLSLYLLELPLSLPRKLTIPDISEENWCKPYAVSSATLAPILLAFCATQQESINSRTKLGIFLASILIGTIFGFIAFFSTKNSGPPKRCLFPWLAGCFLMSITWTYITVEELVSLLVAFGTILGISPSILGLTVLAWGNSVGDLISNSTMALKGGADGAQVAISGCYAGPLFNTLVGLGFSLVMAAFRNYPAGYGVPKNPDVYETVGFLMGGLLWALVILPKRNMQLDKSLGIGLLAIYFCFLFLRIVKSVGLLKLGG